MRLALFRVRLSVIFGSHLFGEYIKCKKRRLRAHANAGIHVENIHIHVVIRHCGRCLWYFSSLERAAMKVGTFFKFACEGGSRKKIAHKETTKDAKRKTVRKVT